MQDGWRLATHHGLIILLLRWRTTLMLRRNRSPQEVKKARSGQSLVEFALVGVILFTFLLGIIDAGRLLIAYSIVSNAAQEGTHYGAIRPRDVLGPTDATQVATAIAATPTAEQHGYTPEQVVSSDTGCSIVSKTREKIF